MNKCSRFPVRAIVPGVAGARNVKWLCEYFFLSELQLQSRHMWGGGYKKRFLQVGWGGYYFKRGNDFKRNKKIFKTKWFSRWGKNVFKKNIDFLVNRMSRWRLVMRRWRAVNKNLKNQFTLPVKNIDPGFQHFLVCNK